MSADYREKAFETALEQSLLSTGGYEKAHPKDFDPIRALHSNLVLDFVQQTQPDQWKVIADYYGPRAATALLDELTKALDSQGTLNVLRHGLDFFGQTFRLAYFAPATALNPETAKQYASNRLTITRQVHFSDKHEQSVDLLLSINGIPTATAELKNPFTGKTVKDAIQQYKDRDHREPLFTFKKRALVHFAVDPDRKSVV